MPAAVGMRKRIPMQHDNRGDFLLALVVGEGAVALYAAYAIILLATHGIPRDQWTAPATVFAISAGALVCTCFLADLHARRSVKR